MHETQREGEVTVTNRLRLISKVKLEVYDSLYAKIFYLYMQSRSLVTELASKI